MIVLSCNNIKKSYLVENILEDISFSIRKGDKVGLVGPNGSGKSTLMKILIGELSKDAGEIYLPKDLKLGYLEQNTHITSEHTIFEEAQSMFTHLFEMENKLRYLEQEISKVDDYSEEEHQKLMDQYSSLSETFANENGFGYKSEINGVLKGLGFMEAEFSKPISLLSGGQKSRVIMAKLLLQKPDIMLLDEPTNHLDLKAIEWLERYVKDYKGTVLIVSHDRYFLDSTVNRIFYLNGGFLRDYDGNYTTFTKKYEKDVAIQSKRYEAQQKEIKKQEDMIRTFMDRRSKRNIRQAKSRQLKLEKMEKIDHPTQQIQQAKITFEPAIESGKDVLFSKSLSKSFGDLNLFSDLNFEIYRGDAIGIIGPNGVGKTTLFKMIMGSETIDSGEIWLGTNVEIGYYDQEQTNLDVNKTIIDEIWDEHPEMDRYQIMSLMAQFLFYSDDLEKKISTLSGGEKGRLSLMKLMLSNANLLILDEPTNHLDIESKEALENALLNYAGTILTISHDRYFLNKIANKIFDLQPDGLSEYLGNFNYYLEKKAIMEKELEDEITISDTSTSEISSSKLSRQKEKELERQIRSLSRKLEQTETEIAECEALIEDLNTSLCSPDVYSDHEKSLKLNEDLELANQKLEMLYSTWENIQEELLELQ